MGDIRLTAALASSLNSPEHKHDTVVYYSPPHSSSCSSSPSSSPPSKNGFAISSVPSSGETKLTCVPLITTKPSFLVWFVIFSGSFESLFEINV